MVVIVYYEVAQLSTGYDNVISYPFEIIYIERLLEIVKKCVSLSKQYFSILSKSILFPVCGEVN